MYSYVKDPTVSRSVFGVVFDAGFHLPDVTGKKCRRTGSCNRCANIARCFVSGAPLRKSNRGMEIMLEIAFNYSTRDVMHAPEQNTM